MIPSSRPDAESILMNPIVQKMSGYGENEFMDLQKALEKNDNTNKSKLLNTIKMPRGYGNLL